MAKASNTVKIKLIRSRIRTLKNEIDEFEYEMQYAEMSIYNRENEMEDLKDKIKKLKTKSSSI